MEQLATSKEVARYLNISGQTLANWAYQGVGPKFSKFGNRRRYDWNDVRNWLDSKKVSR